MTDSVVDLGTDAEIAVKDAVDRAVSDLVRLLASVNPMFAMHCGVPPAHVPQTREEALELLRASRLVEHRLRDTIAQGQAVWAQDVVLRGGRIKDVADALTVSSGAVSKRWPDLGSLRQTHLWFRAGTNADTWVTSCLAIAAERGGLVGNPDSDNSEPGFLTREIDLLVHLVDAYVDAARKVRNVTTTRQWYDLVTKSPGAVDSLINPRRVSATTDAAAESLDVLRLVWRAYHAGISVEDQVTRDQQRRA